MRGIIRWFFKGSPFYFVFLAAFSLKSMHSLPSVSFVVFVRGNLIWSALYRDTTSFSESLISFSRINAPKTVQTMVIVITVGISSTEPVPNPKCEVNSKPQKLYNACIPAAQRIFLVFMKTKANKPPVKTEYNDCISVAGMLPPLIIFKRWAAPNIIDEKRTVFKIPFLFFSKRLAKAKKRKYLKIYVVN